MCFVEFPGRQIDKSWSFELTSCCICFEWCVWIYLSWKLVRYWWKELFALTFLFDIFGGIGIAFIFGEHQSFIFPFFQVSFSSTWWNILSRGCCRVESLCDMVFNLIFNCEACLSVGIPWRKKQRWRLVEGLLGERLLNVLMWGKYSLCLDIFVDP